MTFKDKVEFRSITFQLVEFEATFEGPVEFRAAIFESVSFPEARFEGPVLFRWEDLETGSELTDHLMFKDKAIFDGAVFKQDLHFDSVAFAGAAYFKHATFQTLTFRAGFINKPGTADFTEAKFEGLAYFAGATLPTPRSARHALKVQPSLVMRRASGPLCLTKQFSRIELSLGLLSLTAWAISKEPPSRMRSCLLGQPLEGFGIFTGTIFEQARRLGPMVSGMELVFDGAIFR